MPFQLLFSHELSFFHHPVFIASPQGSINSQTVFPCWITHLFKFKKDHFLALFVYSSQQDLLKSTNILFWSWRHFPAACKSCKSTQEEYWYRFLLPCLSNKNMGMTSLTFPNYMYIWLVYTHLLALCLVLFHIPSIHVTPTHISCIYYLFFSIPHLFTGLLISHNSFFFSLLKIPTGSSMSDLAQNQAWTRLCRFPNHPSNLPFEPHAEKISLGPRK